MKLMLLAAFLLGIAGCGDGSLVDAEVDPQVTDSVNPEISPAVDVDLPISLLGLGAAP